MAENTHAGQAVQAMQSAWLEVLPGETCLSLHQRFVSFGCLTASSNDSSFIHAHQPEPFPSTGTIISQTEDLTAAEMPPGKVMLLSF